MSNLITPKVGKQYYKGIPQPLPAPKPVRDYSKHIALFAIGPDYKPGTKVLVHPDNLQTAMEKARRMGYQLRGSGYDSNDTHFTPSVSPINQAEPVTETRRGVGNPGRQVIEGATGIVFNSAQHAATHYGISRQLVYAALKNGGTAKKHKFKYFEPSPATN